MTVTTTASYINYDADGSTTDFAIPFNFQSQAAWIAVYDITTGQLTKTAFVQGVDYNVVTGSDQRVVFVTPPASNTAIQVRRVTPRSQTSAYPVTGGFPNSTHERVVDKIVMMAQEIYDSVALGDFNPASVLGIDSITGQYNALGLRITNMAPGTDGNDACTVAQATAISTGGVVTSFGGFGTDTFEADGGTDYTLSVQGINAEDIIVTINGQVQVSDAIVGSYTVDNSGNPLTGTVLQFGTAPDSGDIIQVRWPKGTVVSELGDVQLGTDNYAAGSITPDKFYVPNGAFSQGYVPKLIYNPALDLTIAQWLPLQASDIANLSLYLFSLPWSFGANPAADVSMASHKLISLADGTSNDDAVNLGQLALRRRTKSGSVSMTGGIATTITFPWNVSSLTFHLIGPGVESHSFTATFSANGTQAGKTAEQTTPRNFSVVRATSGSNKTIAVTVTGGGTSTLEYHGTEGDA